MARLQILQLPEGAGDERPPWLLIVDELPTGDAQLDMLRRDLADNDITARIGARGALCFESTVNIPANNVLPLPLLSVQGDSQTAELIHAHEQTRLALCDAFLLSLDSTWAQIVETAEQRQGELADLRWDRDELHAEIGLAQGQLHSAALTAVRGKHATIRELIERAEQAEAERNDARMWARHGYEIGQRHCSWSDHGVAPGWLTEGWPNSFDSCEHLKQAAEYDTAICRALEVVAELEAADVHGSAWDANQEAVRRIREVLRPPNPGNEPTVKP